MPDKGVQKIGKPDEKGTEIVGNQIKGVKIIDKNTKTEQPQVEITEGEPDRD